MSYSAQPTRRATQRTWASGQILIRKLVRSWMQRSASAPDVPSGGAASMKGQVVTPMRTYGMRFDVNCSILFTELPLVKRAAAAKAAGVDVLSLNFHAGDMAAGERGIVSHPARAREFRENVHAAVEIAGRVGCTRLNAPYGLRVPGAE